MAGIFISHSTVDKPFVNKLSTDLVNRGFPVWFDSWELAPADSFIDKIFAGLDESFFLIVVLSENSIRSNWVKKELKAALGKEAGAGRKFVFPVKIDGCKLPPVLAGRLFIDFSAGYLKNMEKLDTEFRKWKVDQIVIPAAKRLIPVNFFHYTDVDGHSIEAALQHVGDRSQVTTQQIRVVEEPLVLKLKDRLYSRIDGIESDPYYSASFYSYLKSDFDGLKDYERRLQSGICSLINHSGAAADFYLDVSLYWFCRIMRSRIMYILWATQVPAKYNDDVVEFDPAITAKWNSGYLISDSMADEFYDISDIQQLVMGNDGLGFGGGADFSFWMDGNRPRIKELLAYGVPEEAYHVLDTDEFSKYVIPGMLSTVEPGRQVWSRAGKVIGIP